MNQEKIADFFALWLSGAAKMKNKKEIWCEDYLCTTIEFPTNTPTYAIVRYYFSVTAWTENEFINGHPSERVVFYPTQAVDYIKIDFSVSNGI